MIDYTEKVEQKIADCKANLHHYFMESKKLENEILEHLSNLKME